MNVFALKKEPTCTQLCNYRTERDLDIEPQEVPFILFNVKVDGNIHSESPRNVIYIDHHSFFSGLKGDVVGKYKTYKVYSNESYNLANNFKGLLEDTTIPSGSFV